MKRSVVIVALGGLTLASLAWQVQNSSPALGAELDGFAINTQEKAVTITLFTDQRVPYTTENQGKQFSIILPNTQLSQEQMNSGLPVVIDNKNRFIGRAVPTEDGKVKIVLPNLPSGEYAVSIQQKRPGQAADEPAPPISLKPRPAVSSSAASTFEQVASRFPKPTESVAKPPKTAHTPLRLAPAPQGEAFVSAGGGAIWNPYVVKPSSMPRSTVSISQANGLQSTGPVNTVSVADSLRGYSHPEAPQQATPAMPVNDPLWYLHSLPPVNPDMIGTDSLQGPASQEKPVASAKGNAKQVQQAPKASLSTMRALTADMKEAILSLPQWLLITVAVFLGGIGLFTLIGGLVLLRVLFSQARQQFVPAVLPAGAQLVMHPGGMSIVNQTDLAAASGMTSYATRPERLPFQDRSSVRSLDYLKESPGDISQAVHNTVLVKFPMHRRHRNASQKHIYQ